MCSQYQINASLHQILHLANINPSGVELSWQPHIYPFKPAPVITEAKGELSLRLMNYSLIPNWSKDARPKFTTYNARLDRLNANHKLELIYTAPTWKLPFQKQRCIVPLTSFLESCRSGTHAGNIVNFASNNDALLWGAGIWDRWTNSTTGEIMHSFAIITDEPCQFIQDIGHDRQPVFLTLDHARLWLNYQQLPAAAAYDFLKTKQSPINYQVSNFRSLKTLVNQDLFM